MYAASPVQDTAPTRFIAIGSAPLVEGFGLIGFETYPDVQFEALATLLETVVRSRVSTLLLLENRLARCPCPILEHIRNQQAQIVVVEIPELHNPTAFHPEVEHLVQSVLGPSALELKK